MAFGLILIASVAGVLAAAGAAFLGQSVLVIVSAYFAAVVIAVGVTVLVLIVKDTSNQRRNVDRSDQGLAVKSSD